VGRQRGQDKRYVMFGRVLYNLVRWNNVWARLTAECDNNARPEEVYATCRTGCAGRACNAAGWPMGIHGDDTIKLPGGVTTKVERPHL
jgi:hypothetical protein